MKRAYLLILVLSFVSLVSVPLAGAAEPILIGDISSVSGVQALYGTPGRQAAIMALEEINQKGGVLGRPLQLIMRDDKSLPEEGSKAFRELVAQGVLLVMAPARFAGVPAAPSLAGELKVPLFTVLGYSRSLTEEFGHRYFFRLITSDRVFGHVVAEAMAKQPHSKYCTIGNDFAYGRDITKVVMTRLKELKADVQVLPGCEYWVPFGATDFTPNLTAILAARPQALMFGGLVSVSASAFVKQAKAFGLFATTLGVHPSLGMPANNAGLTRKDDVPEGIFTGTDYVYPPVPTPASRAFFDAYMKRWNQLPMEASANAYTTLRFIARAIEKAGKADREAFIDAAEGMSIDHPALGTITVRPFDHQSTAGWWMGYLTWDETHKRAGMRDVWYQRGEAYLASKEEIEKLRSRK